MQTRRARRRLSRFLAKPTLWPIALNRRRMRRLKPGSAPQRCAFYVKCKDSLVYSPRLIASSTARLRAALLIRPTAALERLTPLPAEPSPIFTRALQQHLILERTLRYFRVETTVIDAGRGGALSVAAADTAVILESGAIMMRNSVLHRPDEVAHTRAQFERMGVPIVACIEPPASIDASEILLIANTAFIGVSRRSNALGRSQFADIAVSAGMNVLEVTMAPGAPALRSIASPVSVDTIVVAPQGFDARAFAGFNTIVLDRGEELAAGVLPLGERRVIANLRFRTSLRKMRSAGVAIEAIDLHEFGKVGLTPSMLVLPIRRAK